MDLQALSGLTMCFSKATLAASGAATTFSTTGATVYAIKGKAYSTAAASSAATPTADYTSGVTFATNPLPINKATVFVWMYNGNGTAANAIKVAQGGVVDMDSAGNLLAAPAFPAIPADVCPFAMTIVKNASNGSPWTFGTSNWNATGITVSHTDLSTLPDRAQLS